MMGVGEVVAAVVVATIGGGTIGNIVTKRLSKPVDDATAAKIQAETAASDVGTLREIIAEIRTSAREEKAMDRARIDDLVTRVEKLEERERHALTRAAVHEAWDQLALAFVLKHDQNFPEPPPLADRSLPGTPPSSYT